jgi:hypothetical protein
MKTKRALLMGLMTIGLTGILAAFWLSQSYAGSHGSHMRQSTGSVGVTDAKAKTFTQPVPHNSSTSDLPSVRDNTRQSTGSAVFTDSKAATDSKAKVLTGSADVRETKAKAKAGYKSCIARCEVGYDKGGHSHVQGDGGAVAFCARQCAASR